MAANGPSGCALELPEAQRLATAAQERRERERLVRHHTDLSKRWDRDLIESGQAGPGPWDAAWIEGDRARLLADMREQERRCDQAMDRFLCLSLGRTDPERAFKRLVERMQPQPDRRGFAPVVDEARVAAALMLAQDASLTPRLVCDRCGVPTFRGRAERMATAITEAGLDSMQLPPRWTANELPGEPQPETHGKAKHTPPSRQPRPPEADGPASNRPRLPDSAGSVDAAMQEVRHSVQAGAAPAVATEAETGQRNRRAARAGSAARRRAKKQAAARAAAGS